MQEGLRNNGLKGAASKKKSKADKLLGKTPDNQLVLASVSGNKLDVISALKDGANINHRYEEDYTALMKAVELNHYDIADILLANGADTRIRDRSDRSAWYFAFFSDIVASSEEDQIRMLKRLLRAIGKPSAEIVMMAVFFAAHRPAVTLLILNGIEFHVMSRNPNNIWEFYVSGLELLDDPNTTIEWPDGSTVPLGKTAFHLLVEKCANRTELITHPVVKALIQWKYAKFRKMKYVEISLFGLLTLCTSLTGIIASVKVQTLNSDSTSELSSRLDNVDLGCRYVSLALSAMMTATVLSLEYGFTVKFLRHLLTEKMKMSMRNAAGNLFDLRLLLPLTIFALNLIVITSYYVRFDDSTEKQSISVLVVLVWIRAMQYLKLTHSIGPLVIVIEEIIRSDLLRISIMVATIAPGLAIALDLTDHDETQGDVTGEPEGWNAVHFTALSWLYNIVISMPAQQHELSHIGHSVAHRVFYLMFLILVPVLTLTLFLAMLNNTIDRILKKSKAEWLLRVAQYMITRAGLVKSSFFGHVPSAGTKSGKRTASHGRQNSLVISSVDVQRGYRFHANAGEFRPLLKVSDTDLEDSPRVHHVERLRHDMAKLFEEFGQLLEQSLHEHKQLLGYLENRNIRRLKMVRLLEGLLRAYK